MKSAGHLVMIGGGTARTPDRRLSLVSAVNGGIAALSKSVAEQGIQDAVHLNLVQPGTVRTRRRQKLFEKWAGQEGLDMDEYIRRAARNLNVTRLGEPHDIAEVIAFLCKEESRWMQGSSSMSMGDRTRAYKHGPRLNAATTGDTASESNF